MIFPVCYSTVAAVTGNPLRELAPVVATSGWLAFFWRMLLHERRQLRHRMPVLLIRARKLQPQFAQRFGCNRTSRTQQHGQTLIACHGGAAHGYLQLPELRARARGKQLHVNAGN
jgi:hypothetical protein